MIFKKLKIVDLDKFLSIAKTPKNKVVSFINKIKPFDVNIKLIRLGAKNDGGYLVPNDLDSIEACFSPGVDAVSEFEEDCFNKGMKIFLADKSVDQPNLKNIDFSFIKKFIRIKNDQDYITLDKWYLESKVNSQSDLILQMDIEGGEYFSLLNISDNLLKKFRVIVIEFHGLEKLWNPEFYKVIEEVFNRLLQYHTCIHIHPNNVHELDEQFGVIIPKIAEFTFIRNDRFENKTKRTNFPHPLDSDNTQKKSIVLPKNWYE